MTTTFQNHPQFCSSRRSFHIWWVPHITEERSVITELSRTQLYGRVPLVDVSDELHPIFELRWSWVYFPTGEVENLKLEGKLHLKKSRLKLQNAAKILLFCV